MSFLNGLGLNSLISQFQIDKPDRDLRDIQSGLGINAYRTTSRHKTQLSNIEVQNEDNTTFLFEYRAYLNSQLTTLITKLTNALTSDLDTMMTTSAQFGKPAMQGHTGSGADGKNVDPGAGRVAWTFLGTWGTLGGYTDQVAYAPNATPGNGYQRSIAASNGTTADGTIAVMNYSASNAADPNDRLQVFFRDQSLNEYTNNKQHRVNVTNTEAQAAKAGNMFEEILYKESLSRVFRQILTAGLFQDLVISAATSLATGSQVQASINLGGRSTHDTTANPSQDARVWEIDVLVNRFTAFYHT